MIEIFMCKIDDPQDRGLLHPGVPYSKEEQGASQVVRAQIGLGNYIWS